MSDQYLLIDSNFRFKDYSELPYTGLSERLVLNKYFCVEGFAFGQWASAAEYPFFGLFYDSTEKSWILYKVFAGEKFPGVKVDFFFNKPTDQELRRILIRHFWRVYDQLYPRRGYRRPLLAQLVNDMFPSVRNKSPICPKARPLE